MRYGVILGLIVGAFFAGCGGDKSDQDKSSKTPPKSMVEDKIAVPEDVQSALARNTCLTCHKPDKKMVGPSYKEVATKVNSVEEIVGLIREPQADRWPGYTQMTGVNITDEDGELIAKWILSLK